MHMPLAFAGPTRALLVLGVLCAHTVAHAENEGEIQAARQLFRRAVQDEEAQKYDAALEKFKKVQAIRDTATVRYRIGVCLESMGRLDEAAVEFDVAVAKAEADQRDLSASARQKASAARQRMPQLTVRLAEPQLETEVRIDDQVLPLQRLGLEQKMNPGRHVVDARAKDRPPFHAEFDLRESTKTDVKVSFAQPAADAPMVARVDGKDQPPRGASEQGSQRTWGIVSVAGGSVLFMTGLVLLAAREGKISSIHELCPNDICAAGMRSTIADKQSAARTFGYAGWITAGVGASAALAGMALLLTSPKARDATAIVYPTDGGIGGGWAGRF